MIHYTTYAGSSKTGIFYAAHNGHTIKPFILFFISLFIFSCSNTRHMQNSQPPTQQSGIPENKAAFDAQGHRGCRGLMPENTIPAMLKAMDLGVHTLEMDISFSKDLQAFLSHEPFFNHEISTQPNGQYIKEEEEKKYNMYQMKYDSIIRYDVGLKPHPRFPQQEKIKAIKPLLSDLFLAVKKYAAAKNYPIPYFNIETKTLPATDQIYHPAPAQFVQLLMKVIQENQMEAYTTIQSFDFRTLQYLHQYYPAMATAMLIEADDGRTFQAQIDALGFIPTIYSPAYALVNEGLIKECHQKGIKIIPWTVNDKTTIEKLKAMGADGLISDYPNLYHE
ncbi:MAG: glycerophosphodiester phosphodiesterase family protein [Chitinophagaceae bacterium]